MISGLYTYHLAYYQIPVFLQFSCMYDSRFEPEPSNTTVSPPPVGHPGQWRPHISYDGTADDFYHNRGIPVELYQEYFNNVIEIKRLIYEQLGKEVRLNHWGLWQYVYLDQLFLLLYLLLPLFLLIFI